MKNYDCVSKLKEVNTNEHYEDFFELLEKIGEGAHAVVYRCISRSTREERAIKLSKRKDEELINGMRECYHIMRELKHPNIIKGEFLFLDEKKISCQMVTELCKYPELKEFLMDTRKKRERITEEKVAQIISCLLNCLVYLQSKGVCHRDLKPDNILYNPITGDIKIIDFEISRIQRYEDEKLDLWSNTGSLFYRAPESFRGGYSTEIDVWAVGIIAYEMLIGELPFTSDYEQ